MADVNITLIIVATVAQFILGAFWYSPLFFGKWWAEIMECTNLPKDKLKELQKQMMPFYIVQLLLTFFTTFAFANFMAYASLLNIYHTAWWIWIGFMAPVSISSVIWSNTKRKYWPKQIFVMLANQLVSIMLAAYILSM